ncbi:MAG: glycosyltransferase family 39 protein [Mycobacterium sp.]
MTVIEAQQISDRPTRRCDSVPRWYSGALAALLGFTAVLYLWGLGSLGWANEYYAAAVQAGTQSWKALLFGSLDSGNSITVDKPPAALWVMALSGRLFGFSPWSMLVPQALMGVGAVALLVASVRRVSGCSAGLLAGAVLALTPVAALMFRFNNPDALLVLLLIAAAYCVIRAHDGASARWIAAAGALVGLAFLTKLLQALLVTPAFALVVLVALPGTIWQRMRDLFAGFAAMAVSSGWCLALISLWPSHSRPYIGGSTDNSLLQLALGYNGLGRVFGGEGNSHLGPSGPPGPESDMGHRSVMFGGQPGSARLFSDSMGAEIAWLLPCAVVGLLATLWLTRKAPRTDRTRSALLLWGGWLVVTAVVFSFMKGIMHPYYTVALAPAVAALVGTCSRELWRRKQLRSARAALALMIGSTGIVAFLLLDRVSTWLPWLRWVLLVGAVVTAVFLLSGLCLDRWTTAIISAALLFGLGGAAAYTVATAANIHNGLVPNSGPYLAVAHGFGPEAPGLKLADSQRLRGILTSTNNRWSAAVVGSRVSGALELELGKPIMSIGGFMGDDNSPTLELFQDYVAQGQIRYFIAAPDGGPGGRPPRDDAVTSGDQITQWVQTHFTPMEIDGATVYDLSASRH